MAKKNSGSILGYRTISEWCIDSLKNWRIANLCKITFVLSKERRASVRYSKSMQATKLTFNGTLVEKNCWKQNADDNLSGFCLHWNNFKTDAVCSRNYYQVGRWVHNCKNFGNLMQSVFSDPWAIYHLTRKHRLPYTVKS